MRLLGKTLIGVFTFKKNAIFKKINKVNMSQIVLLNRVTVCLCYRMCFCRTCVRDILLLLDYVNIDDDWI